MSTAVYPVTERVALWGLQPSGHTAGTRSSGFSAALWTGPAHDVFAEADHAYHTVSFQLSSPRTDVFVDGKLAFEGKVPRYSCQIMPAGRRPRAVFYEPHSTLHLYVPTCLLERLLEEVPTFAVNRLELIDPACRHDPAVERIGQEVLSEMRDSGALSRLRVDALAQDLAIQLLRRHSNLIGRRTLPHDPVKGGLTPWQERRVRDYLEDHLAEDVSLDDLSKLIGLSTFHLSRAFKQSTGLPPHRWRLARRIERAKEMLVSTDGSVTEIALACGFASSQHLATMFRRAAGVSPTAYRRERQT